MVMRHAEKPIVAPPFGVDEAGMQDPHSLLVRGWVRAGALIGFFETPSRAGIARPDAIYACAPPEDPATGVDDISSMRSQETVRFLAAKLECPFHRSIKVGDEPSLIARLRAESGTVLVSWEHKHIGAIVAGFIEDAPQWGEAFDEVWVLDRTGDGRYAFSVVLQHLLAGDR
jgi:hypothetical protein